MYFLVVPKSSENVSAMKAKGLWLSTKASTPALADFWWTTIIASMKWKPLPKALTNPRTTMWLWIFMAQVETILMWLFKTWHLIMMWMRMSGCFFLTWEPFLLGFQQLSNHVNCLRNSAIFGKFLNHTHRTLGQKPTFYPEITKNLMFENMNFVKKWDIEIVNFVKNEILKMWILWKMRLSKCDFFG